MYLFTRTTVVCVALLTFLVAAPAFAQSGDHVKRAESVISHLEKIGALATKHAHDCDAMGDALSAYMDKHGDALRADVEALDALPQDQQDVLEAKFKDRAEGAIEGMMKTANCLENPKVAAAFEAMTAEKTEVKKDSAATELDAATRKSAEKLIGHIEAIADIIETNRNECGAMAKGLDAYLDKHGAAIGTLVKSMDSLSEAQDQALEAEFGPRLQAAFERYMGVAACANDPDVQKAMEKMQLM